MTLRWSWFFIFPLLVQSGYAHNDNDDTDTHLHEGPGSVQHSPRSLATSTGNRTDNAVAIALGVIAGVTLLAALIVFLFYLRRRKRAMNQIEDGISEISEEKPQWWHIDLGSAKGTTWWVLETKGGGMEREEKHSGDDFPIKPKSSNLDRLRNLLSRKNSAAQNSPLVPNEDDPVTRPLPAVPHSHPRYPSILDRPGNPPGFPPPSPYKNANLARTIRAVETREKLDRRRVQIPPKALVVPHGRVIPGLPERKVKSPPGRRRKSWLSRQAFKNPFLPLKESDAVFQSTVSAGLAMRQQMTNSPRSRSRYNGGPATSPPDASRMDVARRVPVPIYEEMRTVPSPVRVPGTGGVPRPKYQVEERAMRSALPFGYRPRRPTDPRRP